MIRTTFLVLVALGASYAQMQRQCTCAEVEPCKNKAFENIVPCADKCKKYAASAGADYQTLRTCIMEHKPEIEKTFKCVTDNAAFKSSCSAGPTDKKVPKRYATGMEIAIMSEINGLIADSGVTAQVAKYVGTGRKYGGCVKKCISKQSKACSKKGHCGLDLPSDSQIAKTIKNCAVQSGVLTTKVIQSLCNCAVKAGAGNLASVCGKLVIN